MFKKSTGLFSSFFFILTLTLLWSVEATAQTITIVQPIGTLVQEWDPALVNTYLAKWDPNIIPGVSDPFDTHYSVSEIQPTQSMYFVRVFTGSDANALGSYITRASVIRGKTPEQIQNILAISELPRKLAYVKVPAGAHAWGEGGGQQTKVIGKHTDPSPPADPARFADYSLLPADSYMNAQLIGNRALNYSQSVSTGNAVSMAAYLDSHLPEPYSDMENIYTTLDFINGDGPVELTAALNQMTPINYDTYSTVEFRNDLLFSSILLDQIQTGYENTSMQNYKNGMLKKPNRVPVSKHCYASWIDISGEEGRQSEATYRPGFNYQTGVLSAGMDCRVLPYLTVGVGAGYLQDHLGWNDSGGSANINNAKVGIYSNYAESDYFFNTVLTGGFNWGTAQRNMNFMGEGIAILSQLTVDALDVNRTATSHQTGQNIGLYFMGGKNFQFNEWNLMPTVQVSYFYSGQNAFNESNAGDLNLQVQDFTAQTVRTQLALTLGKLFNLKEGSVVKTDVEIGWAYNLPLDSRVITTSLPALGGQFSINGDSGTTNELLAGATVSTKVTKKFWINGQYNADLSHGFNSQSISIIFKYYLDAI